MDNNTPNNQTAPYLEQSQPYQGLPPQPAPAVAGYGQAPCPPAPPPAGTVYGGVAPTVREKHREPYTATKADGLFALACLFLGVLFYRNLWQAGSWQGWSVTVFTLCYAATMLVYARCKGIAPGKTSHFWLGILVLTGASYALWPSVSLLFVRGLFLLGVALYWVGSLLGIQVEKKTGNFLPLDMLNLALVVPLRNYIVGAYSLRAFLPDEEADEKKPRRGRQAVLYTLLGIALCVPVFLVVLPMLLAADGGGFADLTENLGRYITDWLARLDLLDVWQYIVGLAVGLYICGLGAGAAHKRYTGLFDTKKILKRAGAARVLPGVSALVLLGVVSGLYVVFIACQVPYYFSAFGGELPEGFAQYSEYARQGFFELCRLAIFNVALLALVNCLCRKRTGESLALRILNQVMVALNLLLIATAFSKMAMYIDVHGLTPKRLLTSVFMVFMAVVWGAVAVLQYKKFSIVRVAALAGSLLFCALCLCNTDGLILRYNAGRYMNGTLPTFDMDIVAFFESQGEVEALVEVYHFTGDEALREHLAMRIDRYIASAERVQGTKYDTLANAQARAVAWESPFAEEGQDDAPRDGLAE